MKTIITTSWDDGDTLDTRLGELLTRYGIKGTFYITKDYRPQRLTETEIKELSNHHEIGAHTLTHPDLQTLGEEERAAEVSDSKVWLEQIVGREVNMFCYPKGFYDEKAIAAVQKAGFLGARTTEMGSLTKPMNPFLMATTAQVYPFPFRKLNRTHFYWKRFLDPYRQRAAGLRRLGVSFWRMFSWTATTKATFDLALKRGGVFHLWGHSWEIEKYGMWGELEELLRHISRREDCLYLTNGEAIETR